MDIRDKLRRYLYISSNELFMDKLLQMIMVLEAKKKDIIAQRFYFVDRNYASFYVGKEFHSYVPLIGGLENE